MGLGQAVIARSVTNTKGIDFIITAVDWSFKFAWWVVDKGSNYKHVHNFCA